MIEKLFVLLLLPAIALAQASCNGYWQYGRDQNQIVGFLTIPHNSFSTEHRLKVLLSITSRLPSSYVGEIILVRDKEAAFNDIQKGYSVQYRIKFPIQNPVPKLAGVFYNKKLFCTGEKDTSPNVITITLDHVLVSAKKNVNKQQFNQNFQNNNRLQSQVAQQSSFRVNPFDKLTELNGVCGTPNNKLPEAAGLVINGRPAVKGQFPWLVAYYHNGDRESGFICGGSLLSAKAVLTAAHCIHYKHDQPKRVEEALFYIGKFYIDRLSNEKNFIVSPATRFIIHPEWNAFSTSFDADIAIVHLTRTVQFSAFVKPICIWTATSDYRDIINQFGIIAGYGKTSSADVPSDKPYWAAMPVTDEATCLRSNNNFRNIISKRTFCVGSRDGIGPCNGDSGGGFVTLYNGKWYLRGLVSSSLQDKVLFSCDTKNYAVFTDVAAYRDWILQYI